MGMPCWSSVPRTRDCDYDRLDELIERHETDEDMTKEERDELSSLKLQANCNETPCGSCEDAEQAVTEDALSLQVRSDWTNIGEKLTPSKFCLLLTTGGRGAGVGGGLEDGGARTTS